MSDCQVSIVASWTADRLAYIPAACDKCLPSPRCRDSHFERLRHEILRQLAQSYKRSSVLRQPDAFPGDDSQYMSRTNHVGIACDRVTRTIPISQIMDLDGIMGPCLFHNTVRRYMHHRVVRSMGSTWESADTRTPLRAAPLLIIGTKRL